MDCCACYLSYEYRSLVQKIDLCAKQLSADSKVRSDQKHSHDSPCNGFRAASAQKTKRWNHPYRRQDFHGKLDAACQNGDLVFAHSLHGSAQAENEAERREEDSMKANAENRIADNLGIRRAGYELNERRTKEEKHDESAQSQAELKQADFSNGVADSLFLASAPVLPDER